MEQDRHGQRAEAHPPALPHDKAEKVTEEAQGNPAEGEVVPARHTHGTRAASEQRSMHAARKTERSAKQSVKPWLTNNKPVREVKPPAIARAFRARGA